MQCSFTVHAFAHACPSAQDRVLHDKLLLVLWVLNQTPTSSMKLSLTPQGRCPLYLSSPGHICLSHPITINSLIILSSPLGNNLLLAFGLMGWSLPYLTPHCRTELLTKRSQSRVFHVPSNSHWFRDRHVTQAWPMRFKPGTFCLSPFELGFCPSQSRILTITSNPCVDCFVISPLPSLSLSTIKYDRAKIVLIHETIWGPGPFRQMAGQLI